MLSSFRPKQSRASGSLSVRSALAKTHDNAITPNKPGSFAAVRFLDPIVESKTYTTTEAIELEALALKSKELAENSKRALKAAGTIAEAHESIHTAYSDYRQKEAKAELKMVEGNVKSAALLDGQRYHYNKLAQGLQEVHLVAQSQIDAAIAAFG